MVKTDSFRGKDFITLLDWTKEEVETILEVATDLKKKRALGEIHDHLCKSKTLFMIFYNQSLRTRNSFEAGIFQMGGHAHFLDPTKIYTPALPGKEVAYSTERVCDVAQVLSRMGEAIAIRCYGDPVDWKYGGANELIRNFAYWAQCPVLNMEDDKYHPFQALADIMTVKEKFTTFKGIKYVMSWAYSPSVHKPRAVPQSAIIGAAIVGCETVLAHPKGMELDEEVLESCKELAAKAGGSFTVTNDFDEALTGAHVVYAKAWTSTPIFQAPIGTGDAKKAQEVFEDFKDWKVTEEKMKLADPNAIYMHCLPVDRSFEADDAVIDGPQSVVFDEAENRLHVQKAVMSLVMP